MEKIWQNMRLDSFVNSCYKYFLEVNHIDPFELYASF